MVTSTTMGRRLLVGGDFITDDDLLPAIRPSERTGPAVANDYWWGTGVAGPPPPVEIPICWLSPPVPLRPEVRYNDATVSILGGTAAVYQDAASIDEYGSAPFDATLASAVTDDASNLATWVVTYFADPYMRSPEFVIDLLYRTDVQRQRLLGLQRDQRIVLTGVPDEFPEGADSLVISGIRHEVGLTQRRLRLTTRAVVGTTPGVPGPWFYFDSSLPDGTDAVPF